MFFLIFFFLVRIKTAITNAAMITAKISTVNKWTIVWGISGGDAVRSGEGVGVELVNEFSGDCVGVVLIVGKGVKTCTGKGPRVGDGVGDWVGFGVEVGVGVGAAGIGVVVGPTPAT